jgi:hypothetical protein
MQIFDIVEELEKERKKNKELEEVLDKIKDKLERYNDKETNMYAPIQECLELLEEIE